MDSYGSNQYDRQYKRLDRRRALAEALGNQAAGPSSYPQQMIPGPYGPVVAGSPIAGGIEKAGYLLGSALAGRGIDEEEKRIGAEQRAATAEWAGRFMQPNVEAEGTAAPNALEGAYGPRLPVQVPKTEQQRLAEAMQGMEIGGPAAAMSASYLQNIGKPEEFEKIDLQDRVEMASKRKGGTFVKGVNPDVKEREIGDDRRHATPSGSTLATIEGQYGQIAARGEEERRTRQTPSVSVSYSRADPASLAIRRDELELAKTRGGLPGAAGGAGGAGGAGYEPPEGYKAVKLQRPLAGSQSMAASEAVSAANQVESILAQQQQLHDTLTKKYGAGWISKAKQYAATAAGTDKDLDTYLSNQNELLLQAQILQKGPQTESDAARMFKSGAQVEQNPEAHRAVIDRQLSAARRARASNEAALYGYAITPTGAAQPPGAVQAGEKTGTVKRPPATAGAPVQIKSDAEFDALPAGAQFVGPDGKVRRKP